MTKNEAVKATRNGAIAAFIVGTLTLLITAYAIISNTQDSLALWNDPVMLVDVILIFVCGFGMLRQSRFAAVFIFLYYILSKTLIMLETGQLHGIVVGLIILYFFGKAIQGSFVYHKIEKAENPDYKAPSKIGIAFGSSLAILFFAAAIFGTMTMTDLLPSTAVLEKEKISSDTISALVITGIVEAGDDIEYFYSDAPTDITESGSVLTESRLVTYFTDENGEILIYELFYPEIKSVKLEQEGNFTNDSIYHIATQNDEKWLKIPLSTEKRGDVMFAEALRNKLR